MYDTNFISEIVVAKRKTYLVQVAIGCLSVGYTISPSVFNFYHKYYMKNVLNYFLLRMIESFG